MDTGFRVYHALFASHNFFVKLPNPNSWQTRAIALSMRVSVDPPLVN